MFYKFFDRESDLAIEELHHRKIIRWGRLVCFAVWAFLVLVIAAEYLGVV